MTAKPCDVYVGGVRVRCAQLDFEDLSQERWNLEADRAAAVFDAPLAMARIPGPASDEWIPMKRGYARPLPAPLEPLQPLTEAHHAAMRGLYGLFAGAYPGMIAREDPKAWEDRLRTLPGPLGLFDGGRLMLWLAARDGELIELSAAPDAMNRIPGALAAAGILRAPAAVLGVPAERVDETIKLRLVRPFYVPGGRIETPEQLASALDGAVQWD